MTVLPDPRRRAAALAALLAALGAAPARADTPDGKIEIGAVDIQSLLDLSVEAVTRHPERASQAPAAVFVLTRDDLRRHGFRTLLEVLASVPGFFAYPGNFPQVGVRGTGVLGDSGTRLLVLIDGHPLTNALGQDLGRGLPLPLAAVERVEVIKGPVGSVYGPNAFEGVVNLVTVGGAPGLEAWAGGEALQGRVRGGEASAAFRGRSGEVEGLVAVDGFGSRGQDWTFPDAVGLGLPAEASGLDEARAASAYARLRWRDLGAAAACGRSRSGLVAAGYTIDASNGATGLDGLACFAELTWQARPAESLTLRTRAAFDAFETGAVQGFPAPPIAIGNYHHAGYDRWVTGELRADWRPVASARLDAGATLQLHRVFEHTFSEQVPALDDRLLKDMRTLNGWLLAEVDVRPDLKLHAGLTYFDHSAFGRQLTPKLAAVWQPAPSDTVKLVLARGFRPPTFVEALYQDQNFILANPGLKAETVTSAEAVYEHRFGEAASVALSLFASRYRELIVFAFVPAPGLGHPPDPSNPGDFRRVAQNGGALTDAGGELSVTLRHGDALQAWGGVSLQRPSPARQPAFPRATANLALSTRAPWRPLELGLRVTAISARDKVPDVLLPGQRARVPAAAWLAAEAALEVPGVSGLRLEAAVQNLTDARNPAPASSDLAPVSELPEAARTLRLAARWRF